jgi:hypothetical protein
MLPVPTYRFVGTKAHTEIRYQQIEVHAPINGMFALVLLWLLEPGMLLCQCRYSKCQKFVIAKRPGKPGRWRMMYCPKPRDPKEDHMTKAHNERKKPGKSKRKHK